MKRVRNTATITGYIWYGALSLFLVLLSWVCFSVPVRVGELCWQWDWWLHGCNELLATCPVLGIAAGHRLRTSTTQAFPSLTTESKLLVCSSCRTWTSWAASILSLLPSAAGISLIPANPEVAEVRCSFVFSVEFCFHLYLKLYFDKAFGEQTKKDLVFE